MEHQSLSEERSDRKRPLIAERQSFQYVAMCVSAAFVLTIVIQIQSATILKSLLVVAVVADLWRRYQVQRDSMSTIAKHR